MKRMWDEAELTQHVKTNIKASDIKANNAQSVQQNLERIDSEINRVEARFANRHPSYDVIDLTIPDDTESLQFYCDTLDEHVVYLVNVTGSGTLSIFNSELNDGLFVLHNVTFGKTGWVIDPNDDDKCIADVSTQIYTSDEGVEPYSAVDLFYIRDDVDYGSFEDFVLYIDGPMVHIFKKVEW